jgi:ATP-dependent DNA helicase RecG
MELEKISGIGPKMLGYLNSINIYNMDDLIRDYPYRFDVLAKRNINDERFFNDFVSDGIVESNPLVSFFKGRMNRLTFMCNIQDKLVKVIIFNRAFLKNSITPGKTITIIGKYNPKTNTIVASNILLRALSKTIEIIPVYHLCKGITSKQLRSFINEGLKKHVVKNNVPEELKEKYGFIDEDAALRIVHNPLDETTLKVALKTLKYEELFIYMLRVRMLKKKNEEHNDMFIKNVDQEKVDNFIKNLPFELTKDQEKATKEMLEDLKKDTKMNRLLQGDVGSGKTVVSFILAYAAFTAGYQTAMMAPTEVLTKQHYKNALDLFKDTDLKISLLTGKMKQKEKKEIYEELKNNKIDLLIGTHALISDGTYFNNLGLVITDEQHRFGVNQRLKLKDKAISPDVLMMSATPIPRTYALTIYGDTDVSSIKQVPKGRKKVITYVKKTSELKDVLNGIYEALKNNNQAYVISPMIEENEDTDYTNVNDLKHKFELAFKNYNVGMLHGKMTDEEKEKTMNDFKEGKINILISTTVIEVGVDVENATVMVIFDADRFGLSTLHQLRGRVGRNSLQSYCYLISDKDKERLKIMEEENDGFKISEADFKLRGQGELFGNRQSGALSFKLSDVRRDYDLLVKVRDDVNEYINNKDVSV